MRVFFLGATRFSRRCLQAVVDSGQQIVGCAGTTELFEISYSPRGVKNVNYCDFREVARELDVPCIPWTRRPQEFIDQVALLQPELILAAGWYYMLPRKLRDVARRGALGLHGSLLPQYRGGAPLVWTMIHGESRGGMTLFHLEDGVDSGDVVGQESFAIEDRETISELLVKSETAAVNLLRKFLPLLANGTAPRTPQDETLASEFPQRSPEDGEIDWSRPACEVRDFIRAQTRPYPGAFTWIDGKKVVIWDADVLEPEKQDAQAA